jgi:hypothetical protein
VFRIHRESDHLPRRGGIGFHRLDDVRGFIGISEASRTGRGADAFLVEQDEQRFGFDAMEGDVGGVGQPCHEVIK